MGRGVGGAGIIPNATVPVTIEVNSNGNAIQQGTLGRINLAANQTYYVDYRTNANAPGANSLVAASLELNNTAVAGSNAVATSGGITQVLAGSAIISTGVLGGVLRLRNDAPTAGNFGSTAMNIIKLM
ncbi:hypothetical protein [Paenibacillus medicaginis]|uniref:BclA C-terminal domain-containing protein n=1 Tax=Paenibacillus medicaginis TaxID=1470560 RepID=A0ABV5C9J1_9BACL